MFVLQGVNVIDGCGRYERKYFVILTGARGTNHPHFF